MSSASVATPSTIDPTRRTASSRTFGENSPPVEREWRPGLPFGGRQHFESDWFDEPSIRVDREHCIGDGLFERAAPIAEEPAKWQRRRVEVADDLFDRPWTCGFVNPSMHVSEG